MGHGPISLNFPTISGEKAITSPTATANVQPIGIGRGSISEIETLEKRWSSQVKLTDGGSMVLILWLPGPSYSSLIAATFRLSKRGQLKNGTMRARCCERRASRRNSSSPFLRLLTLTCSGVAGSGSVGLRLASPGPVAG